MLLRLLLILGAALFGVVVEMTATWWVARRIRNYGIVDIVWSAGFGPLALLILGIAARGFYDAKLDGYPGWAWERPVCLAVMICLWAARLGGHLFIRVRSHHPVEDVRYAKLRQDWGADSDRRMYGFFLLQGALQVVLMLPVVWVALNPEAGGPWAGLGAWEVAGLILWSVAWLGESVADRQLARFKADPAHRGQVCQTGLWRYSRHPNYFFEWLVWVGYAVFASGSPWGWLAWISPALMYHFLVRVTGIPMTEELSVKSRGDAYRAYQRTTNAFFPGPRRADADRRP
jgi:steroid 5-alpha reductase family enzyme